MVSFNLCIGNLKKRGKKSGIYFNKWPIEFHWVFRSLTWQQTSLLDNLTIIRYLGVLYLFLSCTTRRLRAKKSVFPSITQDAQPCVSCGLFQLTHREQDIVVQAQYEACTSADVTYLSFSWIWLHISWNKTYSSPLWRNPERIERQRVNIQQPSVPKSYMLTH